MTMTKTVLLVSLLAVAAIQASWAGDQSAAGGKQLPPPPPGPFMSSEQKGQMAGQRSGVHGYAVGDSAMPPMQEMGEFPPPPEFPAWKEREMPPMPKGMGEFPKMGEMPPPPEFPAWKEQEMPPMSKGMGDFPRRGEMPPPPEFPAWKEREMPPMPKGMGDFPRRGEMSPPPEFPAWKERGMPPMNEGWPEMGQRPAEMPPMRGFNPPARPAYRMRPPMERPDFERPRYAPRGRYPAPQGYGYQGRPGWPGSAPAYAE